MIISRTPLRVSFAGGGTDLPSYYRAHEGGAVLSAAIDRYVYVLINQKFDDDIRLSYSRTAEYVHDVNDVKHPMAREAMKATGVTKGVEIVTVSDIPAEGTGLGSSSSFAVGILNALHAYKGQLKGPRDLAEEACRIEMDVLGEPIGKQDQYAAAYGGLRYYEFHPDGNVSINPLPLSREDMRNFTSHFSLFYSGVTRSASNILSTQDKRTEENLVALSRIKEMAGDTRDAILKGDYSRVGHLLEEGWRLKKTLTAGISNPTLDQIYEKARNAGALGGKVTGAGGGGFFLIAAPPEKMEDVAASLGGLRRLKLNVSHEGSRIIFIER
jgi:D-glycero-alpha-D-manno-heptose-7-phosphate kinase